MKKMNENTWLIPVIILVGILGYRYYQRSSQSSDKVYIFKVGSSGKKGYESFAKEIPIIEKNFRENNFNLKITQTIAGANSIYSKEISDFAMFNSMVVMMQRNHGLLIEPLLWNKYCKLNAVGISLEGNANTIKDMANKKIGIYGHGYVSGTILRGIYDWKLGDAQLYQSSNDALLMQLLMDAKIDMVISDAHFYKDVKDSTVVGTDYKRLGSKILTETNYETPCRIIAYSPVTVSTEAKNKFLIAALSMDDEFLTSMTTVEIAEFESIAGGFKWKELDKIEAKIQPLSKL